MSETAFQVTEGDVSLSLKGVPHCAVCTGLSESGVFYELDFLKAVGEHLSQGDWAVDIGAHIGNHALFLSEILGLRVLAFEANPDTYRVLKENVALNGAEARVNLQNLAISNSEGMVTLTPLSDQDAGSYSILRTPNDKSVRCRSQTLDSFADYLTTRAPAFIKLDIEGAEAMALQGGIDVIKAHRPLIATEVIELSGLEAIAEVLLPLGYGPIGIYNATPTILWSAKMPRGEEGDRRVRDAMDMLRYAVAAKVEARAAKSAPAKQAAPAVTPSKAAPEA